MDGVKHAISYCYVKSVGNAYSRHYGKTDLDWFMHCVLVCVVYKRGDGVEDGIS